MDERTNSTPGRGKGMTSQSRLWKPEAILYFIKCKLGGRVGMLEVRGRRQTGGRNFKAFKALGYHPGGDEGILGWEERGV